MNQASASIQAAQQLTADEFVRRLLQAMALGGAQPAQTTAGQPQPATGPVPAASSGAAPAGGQKSGKLADALDAISQGAGIVMAARDSMPIPSPPSTHSPGAAASVGPVKSTSTDWMVQRDPRAQQATLADLLAFLSRKVGG